MRDDGAALPRRSVALLAELQFKLLTEFRMEEVLFHLYSPVAPVRHDVTRADTTLLIEDGGDSDGDCRSLEDAACSDGDPTSSHCFSQVFSVQDRLNEMRARIRAWERDAAPSPPECVYAAFVTRYREALTAHSKHLCARGRDATGDGCAASSAALLAAAEHLCDEVDAVVDAYGGDAACFALC